MFPIAQHRNVTIRSSSFDAAENTVDLVWTTGADVLRNDWLNGTYIERLLTDPENVRLDRLNAGAAFLDSHDASRLGSILGSVVQGTAIMLGGQGHAKVRLSTAPSLADIVANIRDGIIRNISVGYNVHSYIRTEPKDGNPAVMSATDWEPCELSAVAVPADPGAQIRSAMNRASEVLVKTAEHKDRHRDAPLKATRADVNYWQRVKDGKLPKDAVVQASPEPDRFTRNATQAERAAGAGWATRILAPSRAVTANARFAALSPTAAKEARHAEWRRDLDGKIAAVRDFEIPPHLL